MSDYALIANVYDNEKVSPDWGLVSSRIAGVYWSGIHNEYPLALEFKDGSVYGYKTQMIADARGVPLRSESWHILVQLLNYRDSKNKKSLGKALNILMKDCPYKELDQGVLV